MGLTIAPRHLPFWRRPGTLLRTTHGSRPDRSWRVVRTAGSPAGAAMRFERAVQVHGLLAQVQRMAALRSGVARCRGWRARVRRPGHGSAWLMVHGVLSAGVRTPRAGRARSRGRSDAWTCLHACTSPPPPEPIRVTWHQAVPVKDTGERGLAALAGRRLRSREPRWSGDGILAPTVSGAWAPDVRAAIGRRLVERVQLLRLAPQVLAARSWQGVPHVAWGFCPHAFAMSPPGRAGWHQPVLATHERAGAVRRQMPDGGPHRRKPWRSRGGIRARRTGAWALDVRAASGRPSVGCGRRPVQTR